MLFRSDALLADGHTVTALDNFDPFYPSALKERNVLDHPGHDRWRLIECDIRDADRLRAVWPADVDVVAHLAAKAGVRPSIADPLTYQDVNVRGTQHLLEIARERAKTMHEVYLATLDVIHHRYFQRERTIVPARAMEDVFSEIKKTMGADARWMSVNLKAMSFDHEPQTDFEKKASREIAEIGRAHV